MIREGKMKLCPFRICEEIHTPMLEGQGVVKTQQFMPCIKAQCICYDINMLAGHVTEYCYRENLVYEIQHPVNEVAE